MAYFKENQWNLSTLEIEYRDGEQLIKKRIGAEGKKWWLELERLWSDIRIIEIEEISPTKEQLSRLDKINRAGVTDGFGSSVAEYVRSGKFPDGFSHGLKDVEIEEVSQAQGISLSEREIEALYLAMQVSELELQVLELGGGL